jgi:predicted amino acid dehydrogenase
LNAFRQNEDRFTSKPEAALKYVSAGESPHDNGVDVIELAAYTSVTSLILNLHETVMKE